MNYPIVDSHIHFWDPSRLRYEWLTSVPVIHRPFLPADLSAAAAGYRLEKIVFVQAECVPADGIREVEFVSELAEAEPRIQGIVAYAPLEQGDAARSYLRELARYSLVKGVRRLIQSEPLGFSRQPGYVAGVQLLPEFGLSCDLCIFHPQMGDILELVRLCPDVSFVLDHLGKPGIQDGIVEPWRTQIGQLAEFANVVCKLSGAATEADHRHWTRADLRPYIDRVVEVFGEDRILYGGDWPVSTQAATYRQWIETLAWATASLGEAGQRKLFYDNAARFYRLPR